MHIYIYIYIYVYIMQRYTRERERERDIYRRSWLQDSGSWSGLLSCQEGILGSS